MNKTGQNPCSSRAWLLDNEQSIYDYVGRWKAVRAMKKTDQVRASEIQGGLVCACCADSGR